LCVSEKIKFEFFGKNNMTSESPAKRQKLDNQNKNDQNNVQNNGENQRNVRFSIDRG